MILQEEREKIAQFGKKMLNERLVKGTGGNISIYSRESGLMAISPSGKDYLQIEPEDVVVTDLDGNTKEGELKPSSEHKMHAIFYKKRKDVNSVVHTHSLNAAALSCMRKDLPPIYYLQIIAGKGPIRCSDYALTGSSELAQNAFDAMGEQNGALLANHGVITAGLTLEIAYYMAEQIEFASELFMKANGDISLFKPLNSTESQEMFDVFTKVFYGGIGE